MSASRVVSVVGGTVSQPVAGQTRPQMFLSRTTSRVISKSLDETDDLMAGYSLPHCDGFNTFLFLSSCSSSRIFEVDKTFSRFPGGRF